VASGSQRMLQLALTARADDREPIIKVLAVVTP
jgi:hypothetical protein